MIDQTTAPSAMQPAASRYDGVTILLHWLTAILVVCLFGSALIWDELERGTWLRKGLQSLHISMGLLLAAVILLRIVWRLARADDLPPAATGLQHLASKAIHLLLYVLLVGQVALGFLFRWAQNEPFAFFGLFSVPRLIDIDPSLRHLIGTLHDYTAWTIIGIAALHAAAALGHHYVLKDRVLGRMVPGM
ncbi:cytochrome b [Labrys monachus]|uniref:Cytochrome b561 n=1 Tax=Labrys monachus TaxID=217067 RepID=A0ABU0FAF6_9HYPH|nr:cytochrome b/b6 domain-containing protein [Labrys monachus]MDQ0391411.1 cytochrome b561 [Labrys monachus]